MLKPKIVSATTPTNDPTLEPGQENVIPVTPVTPVTAETGTFHKSKTGFLMGKDAENEVTGVTAVTGGIPAEPNMNTVLSPDDWSDENALKLCALLEWADPALWSRKIPGAKFQYAFLLKAVNDLLKINEGPVSVLIVGAYEDPMNAFFNLLKQKEPERFANIQPVDPLVNNYDLSGFLAAYPYVKGTYDLVVSASVLEHVPDDVQFVEDMLSALVPGGILLGTCDFKDSYEPGDPLAPTEERLYTRESLLELFSIFVDDDPESPATFIGGFDWSPKGDYFEYGGVHYSFASFGLRKKLFADE
jgi:SAM-dependent methyltransferase